ncbi:MAG TPA: hypothetical protein VFT59_01695 [Candidatus Saccharimonadales bacterium]|nr:hypothetical protein [Candidatus Saccharimonadales bacterium]
MDPNSPQYPPQNQPSQQPVAYDAEGRPLYAAPPQPQQPAQPQPAPQVVHLSRAVEPVEPKISPEVKRKHDESVRRFPWLNLSEAEYIISAVRRHPIGLLIPVGTTAFMVILIASLMINYDAIVIAMGIVDPLPFGVILPIGSLLILLFLMFGYIAYWVYINNRFFLTNESVIQEIQTSLFARHEQTVSLTNIEDASFEQRGILQTLLDYGSIRLSTEGDETTYRFNYVANPKRHIAILNNAVEAFKNGRPVVDDSDN